MLSPADGVYKPFLRNYEFHFLLSCTFKRYSDNTLFYVPAQVEQSKDGGEECWTLRLKVRYINCVSCDSDSQLLFTYYQITKVCELPR